MLRNNTYAAHPVLEKSKTAVDLKGTGEDEGGDEAEAEIEGLESPVGPLSCFSALLSILVPGQEHQVLGLG